MTTFPVTSVDDLRGRKILAPGSVGAWLEGTGAVAVDGSLTTYYTQIQTGVADGVHHDPDGCAAPTGFTRSRRTSRSSVSAAR